MFNFILWIIVGAATGMLARYVQGAHSPRGLAANVTIGIVGGMLGGLFFSLVVYGGVTIASAALDPRSAVVALLAAAILLGLGYATSRPAGR